MWRSFTYNGERQIQWDPHCNKVRVCRVFSEYISMFFVSQITKKEKFLPDEGVNGSEEGEKLPTIGRLRNNQVWKHCRFTLENIQFWESGNHGFATQWEKVVQACPLSMLSFSSVFFVISGITRQYLGQYLPTISLKNLYNLSRAHKGLCFPPYPLFFAVHSRQPHISTLWTLVYCRYFLKFDAQ